MEQASRHATFGVRAAALLAFVLIGTPVFSPVIEQWAWLPLVLNPSIALLLIAPLMYLAARVFALRSPFDCTPQPPERECCECGTTPRAEVLR